MSRRPVMTLAAHTGGLDSLCGATKRNGAGSCRRPAGWGTQHPGVGRCRLHGGNTPSHAASAAVALEERRARSILERLGEPAPMDHPVRELVTLVEEAKEWRSILRERVAQLTSLYTDDRLNVERERAAVLLYERAVDRLGRFLVEMLKLDLQARSLKLDQQTAKDVMAAITEALKRAGLAEHERTVRRHLADVLAEMNGSQP